MAAIVIYLIKWALLLAVCVALFMLLMRGDTFHRLNRWLLLAMAVFSMLLPAINLSIESPMARFTSIIEQLVMGDGVADVSVVIDEPLVQSVIADDFREDKFSLWQHIASLDTLEWMLVVYVVVVLLLVFRLLYMYVQIVAILRSGSLEDISQYYVGDTHARLTVHNVDYKPFSWFGWISISRTDLEECGREILTHEVAHVQCRHSYDILFADIIIILQWFNPMAWIMKSLLKDIHEYEADSAVLTAGVDARSYQLLIIKKAVGARLYSIANSFNHSLTKKRITMMCKEKSSLWRCTKALYIVPLAVVAACTFSSPKSEADDKGNEKVVNTATDGEISNLNVQVTRKDSEVESGREVVEVINALNEPEVPAEFPGGTAELMKFVSKSVRYPKAAQEKNLEGKCHVKFVVHNDGSIGAVHVAKSAGSKELDDEAVRVVKSMPRWTPAKHNGENVTSMFTLPVAFRLGGGVPMVAVSSQAQPKQEGEDNVYQVVEQLPEFKEGINALMKFLSSSIRYPEEACEQNIQGKSFIAFIVEKDGSISNVEVMKSSGSDLLDAEAIRVVKSMPAWNPGKQGGEAVRTRFVLPVMFRLQ